MGIDIRNICAMDDSQIGFERHDSRKGVYMTSFLLWGDTDIRRYYSLFLALSFSPAGARASPYIEEFLRLVISRDDLDLVQSPFLVACVHYRNHYKHLFKRLEREGLIRGTKFVNSHNKGSYGGVYGKAHKEANKRANQVSRTLKRRGRLGSLDLYSDPSIGGALYLPSNRVIVP